MTRDLAMDPALCSQEVSDHGRWPRYHQCPRKIAVRRDGKGYCKQHDPEAKASRQAQWEARYHEKRDAEREKLDRAQQMGRVCADITTEDLRRLAEAGGLKAVWEAVEAAIEGEETRRP